MGIIELNQIIIGTIKVMTDKLITRLDNHFVDVKQHHFYFTHDRRDPKIPVHNITSCTTAYMKRGQVPDCLFPIMLK